jgi:hypothetical protein
MRARSVLRTIIAAIAGVLLLLPGVVTAYVWTPVNLAVSLFAVTVCVVVAIFFHRWKWSSATIAALLIAVPPYPYWLFYSESRGWYVHCFEGFRSGNLPALRFTIVFFVSMFLFALIFWAIGRRRHDSA